MRILIGGGVTQWTVDGGLRASPFAAQGRPSPAESLLPQDEIHRPATANVRPGSPQVAQHVRIATAGLLQGVGQDAQSEAVQRAVRHGLVVGGLSQADDLWSTRARVGSERAEGV